MLPNTVELIDRLRALPTEVEYVEFKRNFSEFEQEGRDISALANSAALAAPLVNRVGPSLLRAGWARVSPG